MKLQHLEILKAFSSLVSNFEIGKRVDITLLEAKTKELNPDLQKFSVLFEDLVKDGYLDKCKVKTNEIILTKIGHEFLKRI